MRHNTIALVSWSLAGAAATALLIGTGTHDPAAPAYAYESGITSPNVVHVPDGAITIVEPAPLIVCGPGRTLNLAGDGCEDLIEEFEDGSWRNHATGEHGCYTGRLCDEDTHVIEEFEDGSWRNHTTGGSGCYAGRPCDD